MKFYILSLLILFSSVSIKAVTIKTGHPFITNYTEHDYEVSNNNSAITQDQRGIMYFANEFGILEFDGQDWNIIQIASNRSNITSLAINKDNRLYAGAQDDFGYIDCSDSKTLNFISLTNLIPKGYESYGIIFNIIFQENRVIFQSRESIFIYHDHKIDVLQTGKKINGIFEANGKILIHDEEQIYFLESDQLIPFEAGAFFKGKDIRFILPFKKDQLLIGTYENGIYYILNNKVYPLQTNSVIFNHQCHILNGHLRRNGHYAIGTSTGGVCILDKDGHLINQISTKEGIQNHEIRCMFSDQNDNLWVANKKGIDLVELASPFSRIIPDPKDPIGVYSTAIFKDKLYFATHNGVLYTSTSDLTNPINGRNQFNKLPGLPEINWSVNVIDSILIIGHVGGFSQIIDNKIVPLFDQDGGWMVKTLPDYPGWLIGGTYSGLVLFKKKNNQYEYVTKINGFNESSRIIEIDSDNSIWVAHGYKGIFRITLDDLEGKASYAFYDSFKGLPTNFYNSVFKIWDQIVIGTQYGYYKYNKTSDTMEPDKELSDLIGWEQGRKLQEDENGNVWFITGSETGLLTKHANGSYSINKNPFYKLNKHYIPGFENLYFPNSDEVIVGSKDGAIVYDSNFRLIHSLPMNCLIRKVELQPGKNLIYNDNLEYLCDTVINNEYEFKYSPKNSFLFSYASAFYENSNDIRYQVFLQGFDNDWTEWKPESFKEYTNLSEGEYVFRVKAKNIYQSISNESTFSFTILPPWYKSIFAYLLYFFMLSGIVILFLKVNKTKFKKEKERFINEQLQLRELELAHLKEQNLEAELISKDEELSGIGMQIILRNEKLSELKDKISGITSLASDRVAKKLNGLISFIENEIEDQDWENFELRFDQSHNNFLKKLKEEFPNLSPKDLKICAYLKMNMSSKEIAQILNMSVRGVENARYRVRKRIGLDSSINLTEWLLMRK
ncbi:ligand-binding sensor domain-containing protein [Carboxylicivirga caseinilyticus]|uniref:ligand-binding sensor domain-containing protein n=1 Tax=Carboxylicivirga caseinilyticus TaxID=3417572 RepID=UPI003D3423CC|nr:hypothetical protein [Marinilabiliaceae bacterium A049]